jgi:FrmR/RcnR family transcriptional regulator, repressor of frmRAB operon
VRWAPATVPLRGPAARSRSHGVPLVRLLLYRTGALRIWLVSRAAAMYTPWGMGTRLKSMPDTEKQKLVKRLSRIRGQVDALQRALVEQDAPSANLLHQASACRGAIDGFIAEVIEDHIREQVVQAETKGAASRAAEELIGIVHSYLT